MADVQSQLVRTASIIRSVERQLQDVDDRLAGLTARSARLQKDYMARRAKLADTLGALTRMGRTPRAAALIRPGGPLVAARTSMLLSASMPVVEAQAASFKTLLTDLEKTRRELADKSAQAKATRQQLSDQHRRLGALLDARAQNGTGAAIVWADEVRKINQLAVGAPTLRDFMSDLDAAAPMGRRATQAVFSSLPDDEGQLPVSGLIRVTYGQSNSIGAKSSGLTIEALSGALVVAPLSGVVRYAGPFRGYGNIVIIAHKGGYYSLLAGVDKISVSEGQTIVSGEPVAILGHNDGANQNAPAVRKKLYYELRYGGQPVNPSRKLPGLS